jgi:hypothetical protein
VYRQRLTAYRIVRSLVLGIYLLITLMMLLGLLRATVLTAADIPVFFAASTGLGLLQAVLLLAAAQGIYFTPDSTYGTFLGELARRKGHAILFGAFVAMVVVAFSFAAFVKPTGVRTVVDFAGNVLPAASVPQGLVVLIVALFAFFLAYPTVLMLFAASRVSEQKLRGSLFGLGLGWVAVSGIYVATEVYMWTAGYDATALMYLVNSVIFYTVIRNFRRSASLSGFVEGDAAPLQDLGTGGGEVGMSRLTESLAGKKLLYEVDPRAPYDATLRKTLEGFGRTGHAVFVFTPKASPLHRALSGSVGLKFFLTTNGVSYMKVTDNTAEVLLPQSDTAIFLDVVDKTLQSRKGGVVFLFDSVSEMLLMSGVEKTYKFLRQFLELLHESRSTGLFLFIAGAHEPKDVNILKAIFPNQLVEDQAGTRLVK